METLQDLILQEMAKYFLRDISITDFENWFVPATWDLERAGNLRTSELAHAIGLVLMELSDGHWTEDEARERLKAIFERFSQLRHAVKTASFSTVFDSTQMLYSYSSAGTRFSGARA